MKNLPRWPSSLTLLDLCWWCSWGCSAAGQGGGRVPWRSWYTCSTTPRSLSKLSRWRSPLKRSTSSSSDTSSIEADLPPGLGRGGIVSSWRGGKKIALKDRHRSATICWTQVVVQIHVMNAKSLSDKTLMLNTIRFFRKNHVISVEVHS